MDWDNRLKLYERLYFNELDRREKIGARLTLPFTAMVATIGLLSFMLNSDRGLPPGFIKLIFWGIFALATLFLILGAWFFRKAWYGSTDRYIPTAFELEHYYESSRESYSNFPEGKEWASRRFNELLFERYIKSSTANAENNDYRTKNVFASSLFLTVAILLSLFAAVPFYIGTNQYEEIRVTRPSQPPPPPPPPPERLVKDGHPKPPPRKR